MTHARTAKGLATAVALLTLLTLGACNDGDPSDDESVRGFGVDRNATLEDPLAGLDCPPNDLVFEMHADVDAAHVQGADTPQEALERGLPPETHLPPGLLKQIERGNDHVTFAADRAGGRRASAVVIERGSGNWVLSRYRACDSFLAAQARGGRK